VSVYGGETPSVPGTKVYFINLIEGQKIKSPYLGLPFLNPCDPWLHAHAVMTID